MRLHSKAIRAPASSSHACLLVHGGAWAIPQGETAAHREGLRQALERGRELLLDGATALEAATEAVATMEVHGAFDAGRGAVLTCDGTVELDAGVMDGTTLDFGAVACVRRIAQPIRLARRLLEKGRGQVRLLVADGAERFAEAEGIALIDNAVLVCERERRRYERLRERAAHYHTSHPFLPPSLHEPQDTVGCVARDRQGRLAAATSTGGTPFRPAGRVGDSPLPGCGFYANGAAAASATGWGEAIAAVLLAGRAVDAVATGQAPDEAARLHLRAMNEYVQNLEEDGATGGLIVLDHSGRGAWAYTTPRMARGGWREGEPLWVDV